MVMFSGRKQVAFEAMLTILAVVIVPGLLCVLFMPAWEYAQNTQIDKKLPADMYYIDGIFSDNVRKRKEMSESIIDLTIIMPSFNEEERLPTTLDTTVNFMNSYSKTASILYEILIVDDYSTDTTADFVNKYSAAVATTSAESNCNHNDGKCNSNSSSSSNGSIRLLKLSRNHGKGGAIKRGVTHSRGKYILFADADGATDITYLPNLYNKIKEIEIRDIKLSPTMGINIGKEHEHEHSSMVGMVVGSRAHLEKTSISVRKWYRTVLMYGFHLLTSFLATDKIKDTQCGFKIFTKQTAKILFTNLHLEGWLFDIELIYIAERLNIPIYEISVSWQEIDGSKLIKNKFDIIITSLRMARDMLCMRLSYSIGIWGLSSWNKLQ